MFWKYKSDNTEKQGQNKENVKTKIKKNDQKKKTVNFALTVEQGGYLNLSPSPCGPTLFTKHIGDK